MCVRKRGSLLVWLFDIYGLQFRIERCLLRLDFGSAVWRFALSWCVAIFGFDLWLSLWFVRNWYLEFVFGICEPLVLCFVFERERYLGIWDLGL